MENTITNENDRPFKLNWKRTCLIGFAFFGILLLWQVYDSWCPTFLSELFMEAFNTTDETEVQYLVGVMMAMDNLAALILLPIFGSLSDKTHTRIGKRMPYILVGTFVCAVAFPFIPVFFHYNNLAGVLILMFIVVVFAMMYRNPAVALMPDMTPKPLRSKANGIINIMGYLGGACASIVGIFFVLSDYINGVEGTSIWTIEIPFLLASVLMVISAVILFIFVKENKIADEMKDEMARGDAVSETVEEVDDDKPMSKANKRMLIFILAAEFFWFMADNGISTFMNNYAIYFLETSSGSNMINIIVGGVGSVIGFAVGGIIASKIGRKWTITSGLGITLLAYVAWIILTFAIPGLAGSQTFPFWIYIIWFVKGFGMSLVHINSYPMVVELCSSKKIGKFTGYYYAASMVAQTVTPIALGALLLVPDFSWEILPIYASVCVVISLVLFFFVKSVHVDPKNIKKGLEAFDVDE